MLDQINYSDVFKIFIKDMNLLQYLCNYFQELISIYDFEIRSIKKIVLNNPIQSINYPSLNKAFSAYKHLCYDQDLAIKELLMKYIQSNIIKKLKLILNINHELYVNNDQQLKLAHKP